MSQLRETFSFWWSSEHTLTFETLCHVFFSRVGGGLLPASWFWQKNNCPSFLTLMCFSRSATVHCSVLLGRKWEKGRKQTVGVRRRGIAEIQRKSLWPLILTSSAKHQPATFLLQVIKRIIEGYYTAHLNGNTLLSCVSQLGSQKLEELVLMICWKCCQVVTTQMFWNPRINAAKQ